MKYFQCLPANILSEYPFSDYSVNIGVYICYVVGERFFLFFVGVLVYFSYMSYTVQMQGLQFTLHVWYGCS